MKKSKPQNPLKAARRGSREAEIEMYGRPIPQHKIHQSPKQYNRAKAKVDLKKDRPFDLISEARQRTSVLN